jgi:hypothetical protein
MFLKKKLLFYMVCMFENELCILIHQYLLGNFYVTMKNVSISVFLTKFKMMLYMLGHVLLPHLNVI